MEQVSGIQFFHLLGDDAPRFLNNYLTNDLTSWDRTQPLEGMLLDVKGRVIALLTVFSIEGGLGMLSWGTPMTDLVQHLDRYIFKNDKSIAEDKACRIFYQASDSPATAWIPRGPMVASVERVEEGWDLSLTAGGSVLIRTTGNDTLGSDAAPSLFHDQRIRFGFPWVSQDTIEATLPQELDRDPWDISFTKGCYLGQETVARLDARGHVNWVLRGVQWEPGEMITDEACGDLPWPVFVDQQQVGTVTSYSGSVGLVRIRATQSAAGTELDVQVADGKTTRCRVIDFPTD